MSNKTSGGIMAVIKRNVEKNKSRNLKILLGVYLVLFLAGNFFLTKLFSVLFVKGKAVTVGLYITSFFKDTGIKNLSFARNSALGAMFIITLILVFSYLTTSSTAFVQSEDLGSAKIGDKGNLSGLTGNDGLLLSKTIQLSQKTSFEHVCIIGPTGSGKSSTFFIPNLLSIPPKASIIISDPKGELYQKTAAWQEAQGRRALLFAPLSPQYSIKYNPLEIAEDMTEIREIAQSLLVNGNLAIELMTGKKSGGDSDWVNMSVPLWCSSLLYSAKQSRPRNNISSALSVILEKKSEEIEALFSRVSPEARAQYNIFKQAAGSEKTASSIKTVLSSNLQLFTDPNIIKVSEYSEFHPDQLRDIPTAIYVMVPERKSAYVSPYMSVFYSQVLNKILDYSGENKDGGLPVYFLLDEFANIGIIPSFSQLCATARSRKISLTIGIQGIEQLYRNYGQENGQDILNNLKSKVFYSALAYTSAEYASKLCGFTSIETKGRATGKGDTSYTFNKQRRELMDPDEVRRLPEDQILLVIHNRFPVVDYSNKYYQDRKFLSRVQDRAFPLRNEDD